MSSGPGGPGGAAFATPDTNAQKRSASVALLTPSCKAKAAKSNSLTDRAHKICEDASGSETFSDASIAALNNAKHHAAVRDNIETILAHPYFESILSEEPLGIGNAGHKNVFSQGELDTAMGSVGLHGSPSSPTQPR